MNRNDTASRVSLGSRLLLGLTLLVPAALAQEAIHTTPCDLVEDPPRFDKKLLTLRAPVKVEFEGSGFDVQCADLHSTSVWVTFAGDVEVPIIYCCGSHEREKGSEVEVEGLKLSLQRDDDFDRYWALLTARRETAPTGVRCIWDCFQYRVTATLTGHFFAGDRWEADGKVWYGGYGHLGCCSLFVVEAVDDVIALPTGIPIGDDWDCSRRSWTLAVDREALIARQHGVLKGKAGGPQVENEGERIVRERMNETGEEFEAGDASTDYQGEYDQEMNATYFWLSPDKLRSYAVEFERFAWLVEDAGSVSDTLWTPIGVERVECHPRTGGAVAPPR